MSAKSNWSAKYWSSSGDSTNISLPSVLQYLPRLSRSISASKARGFTIYFTSSATTKINFTEICAWTVWSKKIICEIYFRRCCVHKHVESNDKFSKIHWQQCERLLKHGNKFSDRSFPRGPESSESNHVQHNTGQRSACGHSQILAKPSAIGEHSTVVDTSSEGESSAAFVCCWNKPSKLEVANSSSLTYFNYSL